MTKKKTGSVFTWINQSNFAAQVAFFVLIPLTVPFQAFADADLFRLTRDPLDAQFFAEPTDVSNGSFQFSAPIVVPPGRNGMQPDIKLNYSSSPDREGGIFGYGWSLNIPYIERLNRLGTDKLFNQNKANSYFYSSLSGELLPIVNTSPASSILSTAIASSSPLEIAEIVASTTPIEELALSAETGTSTELSGLPQETATTTPMPAPVATGTSSTLPLDLISEMSESDMPSAAASTTPQLIDAVTPQEDVSSSTQITSIDHNVPFFSIENELSPAILREVSESTWNGVARPSEVNVTRTDGVITHVAPATTQRNAELHAKQINYLDQSGTWQPINTDFSPAPNGYFQMEGAPFRVSVPPHADGVASFVNDNRFDTRTKKIINEQDLVMRIQALDVAHVSGRIERGDLRVPSGLAKNVTYVVYPNAYPTGDLIYYVHHGRIPRLAKMVRFNSAPASMNVRFKLSSDEQLNQQGVSLRRGNSITRGVGFKPFSMWDSTPPRPGLGFRTQEIEKTLIPDEGGFILTKQLDSAFFSSASYPVFTDATLTVYPDANPETNTVDGTVYRDATTAGQSWSNLRSGAGTAAVDNDSGDGCATGVATLTEHQNNGTYRYIFRGITLFDTSTITATDTINAATLSFWGACKLYPSGTFSHDIYSANPSSNTALAASDYGTTGTTSLSESPISSSNYSTSAYNDFTLNSTGLNSITKGGISKFSFKWTQDSGDTDPGVTATDQVYTVNYAAEHAGTTSDPKLFVTYGLTAPSAPSGLQVESLTNPSRVATSTPRFSAVHENASTTALATSYEIQVSTTQGSWTSLYWDSGKQTLSSSTPPGMRTPQIYATTTFPTDGTTYYWRIKFWDQANGEGSWSANGEFFTMDTQGDYGAELESGAFMRYTFASSTWSAYDKRGVKYTFGTTDAARLLDPATTTQVFRWMLDEVRDPNGNSMTYSYVADNGQLYPHKIVYTNSNGTAGIGEVEFLREDRSDIATSSATGFRVVTKQRIKEILVRTNGQLTRRYQLSYKTGDNGVRSLLASIQESAWDAAAGTTTLPAVVLGYSTSTANWTYATATSTTWTLPDLFSNDGTDDNGCRMVDANGDGLTDVLCARDGASRAVYLNNGSNWVQDTGWTIPFDFTTGLQDLGIRFADVNGDGWTDIVRGYSVVSPPSSTKEVYLNNGTSTWVLNTSWTFPVVFSDGDNTDYGVRLADINADGLPDVVRRCSCGGNEVYLNTGSGWTLTARGNPAAFTSGTVDQGVRHADVNGDGLLDVVRSTTGINEVYLNTGTDWLLDSSWSLPEPFVENSIDASTRLMDVNGDGLVDVVRATEAEVYDKVYFNTGKGWTQASSWVFPQGFTNANGTDLGVRYDDVDGDGIVDVARGYVSIRSVYLKNGSKADLLTSISNEKGGRTTIAYQGTPKYQSGGRTVNPRLPIQFDTVKTITLDPGFGGAVSTTTYSYAGGAYYFASSTSRQFSGFASTTKTNSLNHTTRTYFHQGNSSDSTNGEYNDHIAKAGKPYRIEVLDGTTTSANLYSRTINQWARADYGDGRNFVKLIRSLKQTFDGDTSHRDTAQEMVYDDTKGNLATSTNWGEVSGNSDGTFTDTGTDKAVITYTYAASSTNTTMSLPSRELVVDQSGNTVKDTKWTYDNLSFGSVTYGNQTKEEKLKSGSSYASTTKTYNSYGLVTQFTDPRGYSTTYTYDTFNLYPATTTNALGHTQTFQYDYSSGKVATTTDANNRTFATDYDGLDRPIREKQPDITTPTTLVTKTTYSYTDSTSTPSSITQTNHLNSATTSTQYTYVDGLGRTIQARKEAKGTNTFAVRDMIYNQIGSLDQESLPYFASSSARTTPSTTQSLFTTYRYDPEGRILTIVDALGTTTNTYGDWKLTVTDPLSNKKDVTKDALGNLATVVEYLSATSSATTTYSWNLLGKLTKITDALGNIRNFTYDNLGRLLTSEDLHATTDGTYGVATSTYDDAGNLTQKITPRNHTINYVYDALNRPTSEDYTGVAGTEVTWGYDNCANGKGRVCGGTTSVTSYGRNYNPIGLLANETKTIDDTPYLTTYSYDRIGNQTDITYPDASAVTYTYASGGSLNAIQQKDSAAGTWRNVVYSTEYSPLGQETQIVYGNQVATTTNTYDATKKYRLTSKVTKGGSTTTVQSLDYTYDAVGNITQLVDGTPLLEKTLVYTYDSLYRLLSASTTAVSSTSYRQTYTYDVLGNLLTKSDTGNYTYAGTSYANPDAVTSIVSSSSTIATSTITLVATSTSITTGYNGGPVTKEWTATTSGTNRLLVLTADIWQDVGGTGTITSATYNGTALTKAGNVRSGGMAAELWYLVNPASGANTMSVTVTGATDAIKLAASTWTGIDQTAPLTGTSTATGESCCEDNPSISLTMNNMTDVMITTLHRYSTTNANTTRTPLYKDNVTSTLAAGSYVIATTSGVFSDTYIGGAFRDWSMIAASFKPATSVTTNYATTTYSYDNAGNLTGAGGNIYGYDHNNRMTSDTIGATSSWYYYDADGVRVQASEDGTTDRHYPNTLYNIKGPTPTKHIFANGHMVATVRGGWGSGTIYFDHVDHLSGGNVTTDTNGATVETTDYYPFGGIRVNVRNSGVTQEQRKFIGELYDVDSGLSFLNARYYDGTRGQFLSQDPMFTGDPNGQRLTNPQDLNSYSYADNNPIVKSDPTGMLWQYVAGLFMPNVAYAPTVGDEGRTNVALERSILLAGFISPGSRGEKAAQWGVQKLEQEFVSAAEKKAIQLQMNRTAGKAFEEATLNDLQKTDVNFVEQLTLKTPSGVKTRVDIAGRDASGNGICLVECKSSVTAPLTPRQAQAYPEIEKSGATVVGQGKPGFPGGTQIPPTPVKVIRPTSQGN